MANYPTPSNIVSITYQLQQQVSDPTSIRGQLPALTIQFIDDNSVTRNKVVTFREMLPYLRYLHSKALSLGKVIVCDPEATFDYKIVFIIGEPTGGQYQIVQVAVAPGDPCATVPILIYLDHAAPFVVGDIVYTDAAATIPLLGFDLIAGVDDGIIYGLDPLTGEVLAATGATCVVPPPAITPFDVTFQLDGVNFDASNQLFDSNGSCTLINDFTIRSTVNLFCVAGFQLPRKGNATTTKFTDEYSMPFLPANTYVQAIPFVDGITPVWRLILTWAAGAISGNINITSNDVVVIENANNAGGQSLELAFYKNAFDNPISLGAVGMVNNPVVISRDTEIYPVSYAQSSIAGIWNALKYDANGVLISTDFNVCSAEGTVNIEANAVKVVFQYKQLTFINDIVGSAGKIIITDWSLSGYSFGNIYDESGNPMYLRYAKGNGGGIAGTIGVATVDAALLPYNLSFYRLGVLVGAPVAINTQLQQVNPAAGDWDTLVFGTATPPAFQIGIVNQMGVAPQETTQIDSVSVNGVGTVVVPAYPVLPLQNSLGTHVGGNPVTVAVTISNTGVITPSIIRVTDANGVDHDQPYGVDGVYTFLGLDCDGTLTVTLF